MVGDFLASKTYVSMGENRTLEVWTRDSLVRSEIRFRTPEILELLKKKGVILNRIKIRRL